MVSLMHSGQRMPLNQRTSSPFTQPRSCPHQYKQRTLLQKLLRKIPPQKRILVVCSARRNTPHATQSDMRDCCASILSAGHVHRSNGSHCRARSPAYAEHVLYKSGHRTDVREITRPKILAKCRPLAESAIFDSSKMTSVGRCDTFFERFSNLT
jgi:hypothetical protein